MSEDESKTRSEQTDPEAESQTQNDSSSSDSDIENNAKGDDSSLDLSVTNQVISMPSTDPASQGKVVSVAMDIQHTRGPIPDPRTMRAYGEINPSFPERIMAQFENESAHRRREERRKSASMARDIHAGRTEGRRGQILGVLVLLAMLGVIWSLAMAGHTVVGSTLAGSLTVVIALFVTGQHKREQENTENEDDND